MVYARKTGRSYTDDVQNSVQVNKADDNCTLALERKVQVL